MMVGHPGETEEDFADLLDFVKQMRFERLGGFVYSDEEGPYSNRNYSDNIKPEEKYARLDELMAVQDKIASEINEKRVGKIIKVIVDREEPDFYTGRTEFDSPEVDPEVLINKENKLNIGDFYPVTITGTQYFDLIGKID
jgi:ribosomal protein S12 methylthiotransferase